jgi:uncharacterized protein YukE
MTPKPDPSLTPSPTPGPSAASLPGTNTAHLSRVAALQEALKLIESPTGMTGLFPTALRAGVGIALKVPVLTGDPAKVAAYSKTLWNASAVYRQTLDDLQSTLTVKLPAVWQGAAAQSASRALVTFNTALSVGQNALAGAGQVLEDWQSDLGFAISNDQFEYSVLQGVSSPVNSFFGDILELPHLQSQAALACRQRITIAETLNDQASTAAQKLDGYAQQARAHLLEGELDPISELLIAYSGTSGPSSSSASDILTDKQLQTATAELAKMSREERNTFLGWLDDSTSQEQKAYIYQALASAGSFAELKKFAAQIQPDGADLSKLKTQAAEYMPTNST